jgi:hypothetical protein
VYFQPEAFLYNAGYILVDLDQTEPTALDAMCAHGHQPCVVVDTSPGHLQAWVQVSTQPLPAAVASAIGRQLARWYQGDCASTDWRHLGRLAGFTNQPQRRLPNGLAPWVYSWAYKTPWRSTTHPISPARCGRRTNAADAVVRLPSRISTRSSEWIRSS